MKKTLILSAIICSITSIANAAEAPTPTKGDFSSADIQWIGHAKIIPGSDITITGENGAIEPNDGALNVNADGTFETTTPVKLESRLYFDKDGDGSKEAGDLFKTNWTLNPAKPVTVTWGTNVVDGMNIKVKDLLSSQQLTDTAGSNEADRVSLTVTNTSPTSVPAADPRAELNVQASILATVA
ncbi:hypothetical protein HWA77_20375 [Photobacterium damselae subsp. damselae]|uniref:Uncharacterized protein n=1 Tax=Photobacterium damselae subsp. damselae TaxID=85581 RepID=A0A850R6P9_PHODD|nr:hypothetical protein [Photobacterium damselae subsp. damselae]